MANFRLTEAQRASRAAVVGRPCRWKTPNGPQPSPLTVAMPPRPFWKGRLKLLLVTCPAPTNPAERSHRDPRLELAV